MMKRLITGPNRNLAYWASNRPAVNRRAFGQQGRFRRSEERSFARMPDLAVNDNGAPSRHVASLRWSAIGGSRQFNVVVHRGEAR